jgi:xylulokinase
VPAGDRIAALGVSAIGPTVVPLDDGGRALRPAILYGVDTRASAQIKALEGRHGAATIEGWSGMALSSQAAGPKIDWIRETEPDIEAQTRWYVTASTYLVHRLTGAMIVDAHTASHFNPLFDRSTIGWSGRFAGGPGIVERLATIGWPAEQAGTVTGEAAELTGLRIGTPVAVGTVDALAEAVSVGVREPGDLMIMYGSTTFLILFAERPLVATPLWLTAGLEDGTWAIAAGLSTGGSALAWFRDQFARDLVAAEASGGANAFAALTAEADPSRTAGGGPSWERPLVLPYLSGERTPINDPRARGIVAGLSLASTRGDVYRGLVEGIALAVGGNVDSIRALGAPIRRVVAVGGGTADPSLVQAVSDATGLRQDLPASTVGASRGSAFLGGLAAGVLARADLPGWVQVIATIEPDPGRAAELAGRASLASQLYEATRPTIHGLVDGAAEDRD